MQVSRKQDTYYLEIKEDLSKFCLKKTLFLVKKRELKTE